MKFKWLHWLKHDWTDWEQYDRESPLKEVFRKLDSAETGKLSCSEYLTEDHQRQKRRCKVCGYTQDQEVGSW